MLQNLNRVGVPPAADRRHWLLFPEEALFLMDKVDANE